MAGLVDRLGEAGIRAFGPSAAAARIEGSKTYAKELMRDCGVPTAGHAVLRDREEALEHLSCASYPAVLKADVLAAGKGVIIAPDEREARAAVDVFFAEKRFGETEVVLEEFLDGEELSLLALCDGERAVPLAPAQDYKRALDGDEGPNTGGMGSYSPVPGFDREAAEELTRVAHQPIVDELRRRGTPYHGILYAGLMLTADGPRVLEFNCRFGDPETQAVLPRLRSDLVELLEAASTPGGLAGVEPEWSSDWAVTVVLAAGGYPATIRRATRSRGWTGSTPRCSTRVRPSRTAGSSPPAGGCWTSRGSGRAPRRRASALTRRPARIGFNGKQMRRDIAARAVVGAEV